MISNCGKDERGKYSGGQAGDQTGGEYALINWYNRPWNCVLRHPNSSVRSEIARLARSAALNNKIGYDQADRLTFWTQLVKAGYDPAKIAVACEADCSSSTAAVIKAAGYQLHNAQLMSVSQSLTTYSMRNALRNIGFEVLTDKKYLDSDAYLLVGDILLNDQSHVAINVTNGSKASVSASQPASNLTTGSTVAGSQQGSVVTTPKANVAQGDLVALVSDAKWWNGGTIASWVKSRKWYVASINGSRAVLGKSEDGQYNIVSPIDVAYLTVASVQKQETVAKSVEQKPAEKTRNTYTVKSGDNLWSIAQKQLGNGAKYTEIQKLNGLKNTNIYPGQVLILPEKE